MDEYLKQNRFRMRNEVGLISDFYKSTNQDYIVHCEVREGKAVLIRLELSVPDKEQAESMCSQWRGKMPGAVLAYYAGAAGIKDLHSNTGPPSPHSAQAGRPHTFISLFAILHLAQSALDGLGQGLHGLFLVLSIADQGNLGTALNPCCHHIQHALGNDLLFAALDGNVALKLHRRLRQNTRRS